jgi:hypothetical protein
MQERALFSCAPPRGPTVCSRTSWQSKPVAHDASERQVSAHNLTPSARFFPLAVSSKTSAQIRFLEQSLLEAQAKPAPFPVQLRIKKTPTMPKIETPPKTAVRRRRGRLAGNNTERRLITSRLHGFALVWLELDGRAEALHKFWLLMNITKSRE